MPFPDNQIMSLLSWDILRQITAGEQISMLKFNMLCQMLLSAGIPYDVSFDSGTRKQAPALQLTIHINPTATLVLVCQLAPGSTAFTPSP